jgi:hypothetical protein
MYINSFQMSALASETHHHGRHISGDGEQAAGTAQHRLAVESVRVRTRGDQRGPRPDWPRQARRARAAAVAQLDEGKVETDKAETNGVGHGELAGQQRHDKQRIGHAEREQQQQQHVHQQTPAGLLVANTL